MNINFVANLRGYSNFFLQKTFLELPKRQTIIVLIAFVALSYLAYCLICLSRKKNMLSEKEDFKSDFSPENFFDQDAYQYDVLSEDLKDKIWLEEGEDSYNKEVATIKALKAAFKKQEGQFQECLQQQYPLFCQPLYNEQTSEVLYKALKIRDIYKKNYYTFLHGRSLDWKVFSFFIKTIVKILRPDLRLNLIEFLRAPFKTHITCNTTEFINKYEGNIDDHDLFFRTQLISVDAFWLSKTFAESAINFFIGNASIATGVQNSFRPIIDSCLSQNIQSREAIILSSVIKIQCILKEMRSKMQRFPGELVIICLPKTRVQDQTTNPIYRACPQGEPFPNLKEATDISLLEKLQQDKVPKNIEENIEEATWCLQYRLLASHLVPKNGVRIFGVNVLSKNLKKTYKQPIKELVNEIFAASK